MTEGRLADHTDGSHVSSLGGSSGQTGPGWVTAHGGGAEQTQHRPGQPHITPLVGSSLGTSNRVTLSSNIKTLTVTNFKKTSNIEYFKTSLH